MNSPTKTTPCRNFVVRFFSWLFTWRIARRFLIALAWIVTLFVLFHAEENSRGRRAWNEYRQSLEAKGEQLDFGQMIPKEVPDEQNFGATPMVKSWFDKQSSSSQINSQQDRYDRAEAKYRLSKKSHQERQLNDLVAWKNAFDGIESTNELKRSRVAPQSRAEAALSIVKALNESSTLTELKSAGLRPYSRYPIFWDMENPWGILLPHLAHIKPTCERLQLKASAELAMGKTEAAMEDIKSALYLCDSVKDEPFLISYLVRIVGFQVAVQPVWEGLQQHRWSESELLTLQNTFQNYDFLRDLKPALNGERAMGIMTPLLIRKKGLGHLVALTGNASVPNPVANALGFIIPKGWYHFEQRTYCQLFQMQVENAIDWHKRIVSPTNVQASTDRVSKELTSGGLSGQIFEHRIFSCVLLPALHKTPAKTAAGQTTADQVVLACALERYRLAHGKFPEKLEALVPTFLRQLPCDLVTGDPYKYRLNQDGSFLLYSVGWNAKDDGGTLGKTEFDEKNGDWVWGRPSGSIDPVLWREGDSQK